MNSVGVEAKTVVKIRHRVPWNFLLWWIVVQLNSLEVQAEIDRQNLHQNFTIECNTFCCQADIVIKAPRFHEVEAFTALPTTYQMLQNWIWPEPASNCKISMRSPSSNAIMAKNNWIWIKLISFRASLTLSHHNICTSFWLLLFYK